MKRINYIQYNNIINIVFLWSINLKRCLLKTGVKCDLLAYINNDDIFKSILSIIYYICTVLLMILIIFMYMWYVLDRKRLINFKSQNAHLNNKRLDFMKDIKNNVNADQFKNFS